MLTVKSPIRGITTMVRSKMSCTATPTADPTLHCREGANVPNTRRLKHRLASSLDCCHFLCMSLSCCCWLKKPCNSDGCWQDSDGFCTLLMKCPFHVKQVDWLQTCRIRIRYSDHRDHDCRKTKMVKALFSSHNPLCPILHTVL